MTRPPRVALISLEDWDDTWRRNQHLSAQLVRQGLVHRILFVEPPVLGRPSRRHSPLPGIDVMRPAMFVPKRYGGLAAVGRGLRLHALRQVDVLWVNDPDLGVHCLDARRSSVYDVTDDWRTFNQAPHVLARLIAAEDSLARRATTIVCSQVLADRWQSRYGIAPVIVHNGVDLEAYADAVPRRLEGLAPHVGYIGTLHPERLDVPLLHELARSPAVGTLHLIGPNHLDEADTAALRAAGAKLPGPVPSTEVPSWAKAMDVLISPHVVSDFTLSLDAIKSYEYLAAGRPVVATPTSGFQSLQHRSVEIAERPIFVAVIAQVQRTSAQPLTSSGWAERASVFAEALGSA